MCKFALFLYIFGFVLTFIYYGMLNGFEQFGKVIFWPIYATKWIIFEFFKALKP